MLVGSLSAQKVHQIVFRRVLTKDECGQDKAFRSYNFVKWHNCQWQQNSIIEIQVKLLHFVEGVPKRITLSFTYTKGIMRPISEFTTSTPETRHTIKNKCLNYEPWSTKILLGRLVEKIDHLSIIISQAEFVDISRRKNSALNSKAINKLHYKLLLASVCSYRRVFGSNGHVETAEPTRWQESQVADISLRALKVSDVASSGLDRFSNARRLAGDGWTIWRCILRI